MREFLSRMPILTDLLIGYVALFGIINPFGVAFVFHAKTRRLSESARVAVARRIGLNTFIILVVALFIGSQVLRFFGISLPALRIAGGLVVAFSGWTMLNAPDDDTDSVHHAAADKAQIDSMVFFPLTMPLTTGPGAIATAIALGANRSGNLREWVTSSVLSVVLAALAAATVAFAYARSGLFSRLVGHQGTRVVTRMSSFLLLCIGVQIALTGVTGVLLGLIEQAAATHP